MVYEKCVEMPYCPDLLMILMNMCEPCKRFLAQMLLYRFHLLCPSSVLCIQVQASLENESNSQ